MRLNHRLIDQLTGLQLNDGLTYLKELAFDVAKARSSFVVLLPARQHELIDGIRAFMWLVQPIPLAYAINYLFYSEQT